MMKARMGRYLLLLLCACRWHFDELPVLGDAGADSDASGMVQEICTTHWCWENTPPPEQLTLRAIDGIDGNHIWAVGDGGVVRAWDGSTWGYLPSPSTDALVSIYAVSASDITVGGQQGMLWHWNGSAWSQQPSGVVGPVFGLSRDASGTQVFTAGDNGTTSINGLSLPTLGSKAAATRIRGLSTTDLWRLGDITSVAHWDGSTWNDFPLGDEVWGLWPVSTGGAAWVGGYNIWSCTPGNCTNAVTGTFIRGMWGFSDNDVWAVGSGPLQHYTGTWTAVPSPTNLTLLAMWGAASNDAWAVGQAGVILHYDGSSWTVVAQPRPSLDAWGPYAVVDDNDRWVESSTQILHLTGSPATGTLTATPLPAGAVVGDEIRARSANDVFAINTAHGVMHWDGTQWTDEPTAMPQLDALAVAPTEVIAGAYTAMQIWQRDSAGTWTMVFTTAQNNEYHGACIAADGTAMVVARTGYATKRTAGVWANNNTLSGRMLLECATDGTNFWTIGADEIQKYNGTSWAGVTSASHFGLFDVLVTPSAGLYIAGVATIQSGDGTTFQTEALPTGGLIYRLAISPSGTIYALGSDEIFLRRR
jgi:hypothetical protein